MPSHKHKKKKENHKQSRKNILSSSDNENSPWSVELSDSDSDESKSEERLTSLVRKSYMNHLQQALTQNFEGWIKNSNEPYKDSIKEIVDKWAAVLEQKALRACMISELYRTTMMFLIKEIKANTSERKLCIEEKDLHKLNKKLPLNRETQTDNFNADHKIVCAAETQTDAVVSSLLQLPFPKSVSLSPSSRPYDPAIDFSDSPSSGAGVSSSLGSKAVESSSITPPHQDVCNITSTSDFTDQAQFLLNNLKTTNITNVMDCLGVYSTMNVDNQFGNNAVTVDRHAQQILSYCKNNVKAYNQSYNKNINVNSHRERIHKKKQAITENVSISKDNLDARLTAMGLLSDIDNTSGNTTTKLPLLKTKKNNWFAEEIAQSCNLTRILLRMSTRQRERVLIKIKRLFGDEDESLTELSEDNIAICRKRIASVVVMELTPIYQAKRIASRHLFKFLAKKITKSIMEQSYAPDSRSIRWKVQEFFSDGKVITRESDCV